MNCPKCRTETLHPTAAPIGVSTVHRCTACEGLWFALDEWDAMAPEAGAEESRDFEGDARPGLCPGGHGMLIRASVDSAGFYLDRCGKCGGTWFDKGEWEKLSADGLLGLLEDLWTPSAQRTQRQAAILQAEREDLEKQLGADLLAQVDALIEALQGHPQSALAIAHLRNQLLH